jgi:hypothetical protein
VSWHPCRIVSLCGSWPAAATELAGYKTRGRDPAGWLGKIDRPAQAPAAAKTRLRSRSGSRFAICDLQLSCGYVLRLLIAGVPPVLPEAP